MNLQNHIHENEQEKEEILAQREYKLKQWKLRMDHFLLNKNKNKNKLQDQGNWIIWWGSCNILWDIVSLYFYSYT